MGTTIELSYDAELAAAVQAAVDAMLPHIREQVREEYRTGAVTSGSNPPPVTIHTWLERFNKQKPRHPECLCIDSRVTRRHLWKAYKTNAKEDMRVSFLLTWQLSKSLFYLQVPSSQARALEEGVPFPSAKGRVKIVNEYMQRIPPSGPPPPPQAVIHGTGFSTSRRNRRRTYVGGSS
ncbi:hypothetical protein Tco_0520671 [Tanacetum coccineum]